jgi:hypothetical protein
MVELLGRADREGRRLFAVKRAAGDVVCAALFQGNVAFDEIDDVDAVEQVLLE